MTWFTNFLYSQLLVTLPYPTKDFTGQTIIITGANTGPGFEAAKHFIRLHASKVILAVRSLEKGRLAKESILTTYPNTPETAIEVWALDLSSYNSVKAFGEKVQGMKRFDAVLENAGIGTGIWKEVEGNESTITVNVISTELLAFLVLPKLRETAVKYNVHPRLSIVASDLHFVVKFQERKEADIFRKLNVSDGTGKINMMERYGVSKLLEVFFVREIASRITASTKPKVIVNCMTPGACRSEFDRESTGFAKLFGLLLQLLVARTTEAGSRPLVAGISAGEESYGAYMADCIVARPSELVLSGEGRKLQERLWEQTMKKLDAIQPGIEKIL